MMVVMVVLLVVLQAGRVTRPQLGQSAAGCGELGAQVSHLLAGWLDGPIDPLSQLLVVLHHFQDFPLRSKSTQRCMVSSTLSEARRSRRCPLPCHTHAKHTQKRKNPKSVCPLLLCSECQQERPNLFKWKPNVRWKEKERERVKECNGGTKQRAGERETSRWKNALPAAASREDTVHWKMTCSLLNGTYHVRQVSGGREREGSKVQCFWNSENCGTRFSRGFAPGKQLFLCARGGKWEQIFFHSKGLAVPGIPQQTLVKLDISILPDAHALPPLSLSIHYIFILLSLEILHHACGCRWGWVS